MLHDVLTSGRYRRAEDGRYFVLLSLAEAETIRMIMHMRRGKPLVEGKAVALALRCLPAHDAVFDQTDNYPPPPRYQVIQRRYRGDKGEIHGEIYGDALLPLATVCPVSDPVAPISNPTLARRAPPVIVPDPRPYPLQSECRLQLLTLTLALSLATRVPLPTHPPTYLPTRRVPLYLLWPCYTHYGYTEHEQASAAYNCFRFVDSAMHFKPEELNVLLRSIPAKPVSRRLFFTVVVACRRRLRKAWEQTP